MNKLTAAVICFALSGLFAWISATSTANALNARSHATESGLILMIKQPPPDYGIAGFAMFGAIAMLVVGAGCIVACLVTRRV